MSLYNYSELPQPEGIFAHNTSNLTEISQQLISMEPVEQLEFIPSWTTAEEILLGVETHAQNNSLSLVKIFNTIDAQKLGQIRMAVHSILQEETPLELSDQFSSVQPELFRINNLSKSAIRILLSFLTGLPVERIRAIGVANRKSAFLLEFPNKTVVARYWNMEWERFHQIFSLNDQTFNGGTLYGMPEPVIHHHIGRDFAPYSIQVPFMPIDIVERVIPFSEFSSYIDFADPQYAEFIQLVRTSRAANPFGTGKYDDWGIGIRELNGQIYVQAIDFDWSDPQYSGISTLADIRSKGFVQPLRVPISQVPEQMLAVLIPVA